ncbi:hypothetical protein DL98DRAFT_518018 [Cadophora sp. DSE1049]|nr:hypothetical protein DL98DRAFT_518018 [Cadophora sp. DSE1049]
MHSVLTTIHLCSPLLLSAPFLGYISEEQVSRAGNPSSLKSIRTASRTIGLQPTSSPRTPVHRTCNETPKSTHADASVGPAGLHTTTIRKKMTTVRNKQTPQRKEDIISFCSSNLQDLLPEQRSVFEDSRGLPHLVHLNYPFKVIIHAAICQALPSIPRQKSCPSLTRQINMYLRLPN